MRDNYHDHLDAIGDDLVEMSRLVAVAVRQATTALVTANLQLAEAVIAGDEVVNELYHSVESQAYDLLARQQPVAGDLRVLVTSLRMVVDLERAGDYAVHLAKIARRRHPASAVPAELIDTIVAMGQTAERIANKAGRVIATRDIDLARELLGDDDAMDMLQRRLFTIMLGGGGDHGTEAAIDVTLAGRYYERLADHAVAVARRVTYLVTGEHRDEPALD
ncbi:MAG: phoU [Frankiales bacterium]|jgi:phosphate transport system protein|nr:phoU [Frankiales bacterium]